MKFSRRTANIVIASVILVHFALLSVQEEYWPVSNYPMFSRKKKKKIKNMTLVGITKAGTDYEIPTEPALAPFSGVRLRRFLGTFRKWKSDAKKRRAMAAVLQLYNKNKMAGIHGGPDLAAIKVVRSVYTLKRNLENVDKPDKVSVEFVFKKDGK